jgi:hypothetical protein
MPDARLDCVRKKGISTMLLWTAIHRGKAQVHSGATAGYAGETFPDMPFRLGAGIWTAFGNRLSIGHPEPIRER